MNILFVNVKNAQCGVYQYGKNFVNSIQNIKDVNLLYVNTDKIEDVDIINSNNKPDIIIFNYHPGSLKFVNPEMPRRYQCESLCIVHEPNSFKFDLLSDSNIFQYSIFPDGEDNTFVGRRYSIGRFLPEYENKEKEPEIPTIGSMGFASPTKGFHRIINHVNEHFDEAIIRINIPVNNSVFYDTDGAHRFDSFLKGLIKKPGVKLELTHDFLNQDQLLDFLAKNSINVFPYEETDSHGGLSSSLDLAIASKRPIAITKAKMFRFMEKHNLPIYVEDKKLKEIIKQGSSVLEPLYEKWSIENFGKEFELIAKDIIKKKNPTQQELKVQGFNRILDDTARAEYDSSIQRLWSITPDMMKRKIERANIQQGFSIAAIDHCISKLKEANPDTNEKELKFLCIGSYEDTCCDAMIKLGYNVTEVEPMKNYDLNTFYDLETTKDETFDIVFSISVLEHVENDVEFMNKACRLLKKGGYGVFTVDYNDIPGARPPQGNFKLYTQKELKENVIPALENCSLIDEPNWDCPNPDFTHDNTKYTFASLVFKKDN